jgi:hypothetical protein
MSRMGKCGEIGEFQPKYSTLPLKIFEIIPFFEVEDEEKLAFPLKILHVCSGLLHVILIDNPLDVIVVNSCWQHLLCRRTL